MVSTPTWCELALKCRKLRSKAMETAQKYSPAFLMPAFQSMNYSKVTAFALLELHVSVTLGHNIELYSLQHRWYSLYKLRGLVSGHNIDLIISYTPHSTPLHQWNNVGLGATNPRRVTGFCTRSLIFLLSGLSWSLHDRFNESISDWLFGRMIVCCNLGTWQFSGVFPVVLNQRL